MHIIRNNMPRPREFATYRHRCPDRLAVGAEVALGTREPDGRWPVGRGVLALDCRNAT